MGTEKEIELLIAYESLHIKGMVRSIREQLCEEKSTQICQYIVRRDSGFSTFAAFKIYVFSQLKERAM